MVTRRQLHLLNREFDIHVRNLKLVNGFKAHNLVIKENTDTGPLIYIDNPLESRVPHAYLSLDEFRKELEKRATRQRDKKSKSKQTEVYFEDSDVDFTIGKNDMRRKKVLGGAKIFEAKRTKSRHFEHTFMPGLHRGKKYHHRGPYYYQNRNFNMTTYKVLHSINHFNNHINITTQRKPKTQVTTETHYLPEKTEYSATTVPEINEMVESLATTVPEINDMVESLATTARESNEIVQLELQASVEETYESIASLEKSAASKAIPNSKTNGQPKKNLELEQTVKPKNRAVTEDKADIEIIMESKLSWMNPNRKKVNPLRLLGLRSGMINTTKVVSVTINKAHNLPTRILLEESSTVAISLNVTKQDYINSTIQFRANKDNETMNTEGDLTDSDTDVAQVEMTTEVNEKTTEVNETTTESNEITTAVDKTTDHDVTEAVITTERDDTSKGDDVTETVTTTEVSVKTKEQPVRPIWMRPRYKKITTTTTRTTRRTLGVSSCNYKNVSRNYFAFVLTEHHS